MRNARAHGLSVLLLTASLSVYTTVAASSTTSNATAYCSSDYRVQQQLDMTVQLGDSVQRQHTVVDITIHARGVATPATTTLDASDEPPDTRAYIMLITPNHARSNGVEKYMTQRYQHPFLVEVDAATGKLLDLQSTVTEQAILNEYRSFYDLFQFAASSGQYTYRDGNGQYRAQITHNGSTDIYTRSKTAYLPTDNKTPTQILASRLTMTTGKQHDECFYESARGAESFKTTMGSAAYVQGTASVTVSLQPDAALDDSHYFYKLSSALQDWPLSDTDSPASREDALAALPAMMQQLATLSQNSAQFLQAMLNNRASWPYLADYIQANPLPDAVSKQLFWALDKIDTPDAVNTLATLATGDLPGRDQLRAAIALGSTRARLDDTHLAMLKNQLAAIASSSYAPTEKLTFVRMLGAVAQRRADTAPTQSIELKEVLYAQVGSYSEDVNAAVLDAIGNLGNSIDNTGENLLLQQLDAPSNRVRQSAAAAFTRLPYNSDNSKRFIQQLRLENNPAVQNTLLAVISRTNNRDADVKQQLLTSLDSPTLRRQSLSGLKKIDYTLQPADIQRLESRLRLEQDFNNQQLLAALIIKNRRR